MHDRRIWIVHQRFERIRDLLFERGYLIDPGSRDPNEWREHPPPGLVRLKGVRLRGEGDEAEPDPRISFSIVELWLDERVEGAHEEQGYWLAGYAYHGQVGELALRYCFDPQGHPEMPFHHHPSGSDAREQWRLVSPEEALDEVEALIAEEESAGHL
jgi:hypothetical protein